MPSGGDDMMLARRTSVVTLFCLLQLMGHETIPSFIVSEAYATNHHPRIDANRHDRDHYTLLHCSTTTMVEIGAMAEHRIPQKFQRVRSQPSGMITACEVNESPLNGEWCMNVTASNELSHLPPGLNGATHMADLVSPRADAAMAELGDRELAKVNRTVFQRLEPTKDTDGNSLRELFEGKNQSKSTLDRMMDEFSCNHIITSACINYMNSKSGPYKTFLTVELPNFKTITDGWDHMTQLIVSMRPGEMVTAHTKCQSTRFSRYKKVDLSFSTPLNHGVAKHTFKRDGYTKYETSITYRAVCVAFNKLEFEWIDTVFPF